MKKLITLVLLCSMTMGMIAAEVGEMDADKSCCPKPCDTCPTTTSCPKPCCKTALTPEEQAAEDQRCGCSKPKPGRSEVGEADADKSCCNTCPTTTCSKPCCSSCGCKTALTEEEEKAGEQRCACSKPRPGRSEVGEADADKSCCPKPCDTCPTTTCCPKPCCKTALTPEEQAAEDQRCACSKPRPGKKAIARITVAKAMKKNQ